MEKLATKISRNWVIRMVIAGVAFVGFGAFSLYDGKIRYPEVNREFRNFLAEHAGVDAADLKTIYGPEDGYALKSMQEKLVGVTERWNAYWQQHRKGWLARRGWKNMDQTKLFVRERVKSDMGIPGNIFLVDKIHNEADLRTQLLMAAICLTVGLIILFRLVRAVPKSAWADDSVFHTLNGKDVPFASISGFDKKKWDRKSIAYVLYDHDGKNRKALLDEWIFTGSAAILERLEQAVNPTVDRPTEETDATEETTDQPDNLGQTAE